MVRLGRGESTASLKGVRSAMRIKGASALRVKCFMGQIEELTRGLKALQDAGKALN